MAVSSLVDTWIIVRDLENDGERSRALSILKSRGMSHSNQVREFRMTERGVELIEVYLGPDGILTGAARVSRQAHDRALTALRERDLERRRRAVERRQTSLEAQIAAMRDELEWEAVALDDEIQEEVLRDSIRAADRAEMARARQVDLGLTNGPGRSKGQARRNS